MHNNNFSLEWINEQTEKKPEFLSAEGSQIVSDLHDLYEPLAECNAHSLARVQARLAEKMESTYRTRGYVQPPQVVHTLEGKQKTRGRQYQVLKGAWQRRLELLVAVIFVALLVGSMAAIFSLVRQRQEISVLDKSNTIVTSEKKNAPAHIPPSPGIYITAEKGGVSEIIKLDLKTRKPLWSQPVNVITLASAITVAGNTVYVSSASEDRTHNYVYALNAENGEKRWSTDLGDDIYMPPVEEGSSYFAPGSGKPSPYQLGVLSTPVVHDDMVYVTSRSGKLYALDAVNGKKSWLYDTGKVTVVGTTIYDNNYVAVAQDTVYGVIHNKLYAIDARTHKEIWSINVEENQLLGEPKIVDGVIYTSSHQVSLHSPGKRTGFVYAFDTKDGSQIWRFAAGDWVRYSPVVVNGVVYFGSFDYHVYALKAEDGSKIWSYNTGGYIFDAPLVEDGVVYAFQTGNADEASGTESTSKPAWVAIDAAQGKLKWRKETLLSLDTVQDGVIYVYHYGVIYAYSTKDGAELWKQNAGGGPTPLITVIV